MQTNRGRRIRVVVAEDSVTTRELLVELLSTDPAVEVVGEAKNGIEALELTARLRPDVVTMDIEMPGMNGFEATKRIMVEAPTPIVIVSASVDDRQVEVSMHALRAGAVAVLPKPHGPSHPDYAATERQFLTTIKSMSQVKVVRRWREAEPPARPRPTVATSPAVAIRVVAIATSTGGPAALQRILSDLPGDLPVPVLVVQHIADGFVQGMASWLNASSPLTVKVAEEGEPLLPGVAYVAPDERHLSVAPGSRIALSGAPAVGGFRPSASVLFESVAARFGNATLALILTGMGSDGVAGLRAVRDGGGTIIAQDQETSVVFGMPAAAIEAGLADVVLPLFDIGPHIQQVCRKDRT